MYEESLLGPYKSALRYTHGTYQHMIVLAMFLARRDRPGWKSPKRQLLKLPATISFHWWSLDIIADYERGALAVESDERLMLCAALDRLGFELYLGALRLIPAMSISATMIRKARRRLEQAMRSAKRDLDDAVNLACAVDGDAHLIVNRCRASAFPTSKR